MSIEKTDSIDFVGLDRTSSDVILTISDHLPWNDKTIDSTEHLALLEGKINAYLQFIESGQLVENYPNSSGKKVIINVMGKYPLNDDAEVYYEKAGAAISRAGYKLSFQLFGSES